MLIALAVLVFAGRLVYVQVVKGPTIAAEAISDRETTRSILAERGEIVDANGVVLATSVERYVLWVNQTQLASWKKVEGGTVVARGPAGAAELLAPVLDREPAELGALLTGKRGYKVVEREITPEAWQAIRELRITGIGADRFHKRVYPNDAVAGNVVGFLGAEGAGLAGLEQVYDATLKGTPGMETFERGNGGQRIPGGQSSEKTAVPGRTIRTTILRDLQWRAEVALNKRVKEMGATWGTVVALDVKTGAVLALADSGAVDPNVPGKTDSRNRGSRAVTATFEPGSTAKVVTMAAALERGLITPTSRIRSPYRYTTANGQVFRDSHDSGTQKLTATGVLAQSSNTGTVQIGEQMPTQVVHDYLSKFGFGSKTGIGLPGEEGGLLRDADDWDGRTRYTVLFGQGLSGNALQITQVFATIANGGVAIQPHLVDGYVEHDGSFTPAEPAKKTRVVSEETADEVMLMLESAVDDGTGTAAQIPGYRVAGKTGTAQAADGKGGMSINVASFIGAVPADDPRIVVGVVLFDPKATIYGGAVSGPVFKDVASFALQQLAVPPSGAEPSLYPAHYK